MQNTTEVASRVQHQVAGAVRAEMARHRLSQTDLAGRMGWTQQTLSRRLTGAVPFDVAELATVAEILGIPLSTLLPASAA